MKVYNSLTKKVEEFEPVEGRRVVMYMCGLTPYDSAHIGHARTYVAFDCIKRYLKKKGYDVFHIQNITDVDDKIIKRCRETAADPRELPKRFHDEALELFGKLNIIPADVYPAVTEHIPDIIGLIKKIMDRGFAYETKTGVYFDVSKFVGYGKLSGQDLEQIEAGARKTVDETKEDPADFAIWKKTDGEIIEFDSPWGKGRPGWHIECSAMALKYGKGTLDIHGGARDLIFPHHENEIAQSEAATGQPFCRYWVHTGFLTVEHEKMSKSLGNFITLKDALSRFPPNSLRLFYLQAHYRSPIDYEEETLLAMNESTERIFNTMGLVDEELDSGKADEKDGGFRENAGGHVDEFYKCMDDDFDTPGALAALFSLLRTVNTHLASEKIDRAGLEDTKKEIIEMVGILGLKKEEIGLRGVEEKLFSLLSELGIGEKPADAEAALERIIALREEARSKKDFKKSDSIRAKLKDIGVLLEDREGKVRWKRVK